jgi:hypothetical protein
MSKKDTGTLIQLVGLVVTGAGIGLELALGGHWWLVVITVGSVVFAVGTKLKGS